MNKPKNNTAEPEYQRVPPQDIELENYVLGSMMIDKETTEKALEILDESCFYKPANKTIFIAMQELSAGNHPVDMMTVADKLKVIEKLDEIGGAYQLTELTSMVSSLANVEHYSLKLLEKAKLRKLISIGMSIVGSAYAPDADYSKISEFIFSELDSIQSNNHNKYTRHIERILQEVMDDYEDLIKKGKPIYISTGFSNIDSYIYGFGEGKFIVIAGRPSMGKTAIALDILRNLGNREIPAVFFSLEMSAKEIVQRMISSQSIQYSNEAFSSRIFKVASVPDEKMHRIIYRNVGKLSQMPIFIDDRTALTAQAIKNTILKLRRNFDIKVIFIDRLGLMKHPTTKNSRLDIEMGLTVQFLKNIAKDLNITVVLLHQLRRSVEGRADKRPFLSELRECGALEEDADIIWFIYRESYYNKKSDDNTTEMIIAKNRDGKTGKINLMFLPEYTTFIKIDDESEEPPAEIVGVVVGVGGGGGVGGGVGDEK